MDIFHPSLRKSLQLHKIAFGFLLSSSSIQEKNITISNLGKGSLIFYLLILFYLFIKESFQVFVIIMFKILNCAARSLETLLDGEVN